MSSNQKFERKIANLFNRLERYFKGQEAFLGKLKQEALHSQCRLWVTRLDSALMGRWAEEELSDSELVAARRILAPEFNDLSVLDFLLVLGLATAVAVGTTLFWLLTSNYWIYLGAAGLVVLAVCLLIAHRLAIVKPRISQEVVYRERLAAMMGGGVLAFLIAAVVALSFVGIPCLSVRSFNAGREILINGDFKLVSDLAKNGYGVDVVIGPARDSWAQTSLVLRAGASGPASMSHESWYCELNISRESTLASFTAPKAALTRAWLLGLMMHELGHCLDADRDKPLVGRPEVGTHSIAPGLAGDVHDTRSFLTAESEKPTELWREALADMFAVGYWKLNFASDAGDLIGGLLKTRNSHAEDTGHRTSCWIEEAEKAMPPVSEDKILEWADHLRLTSACSLALIDTSK
jgi:hypothetical protein